MRRNLCNSAASTVAASIVVVLLATPALAQSAWDVSALGGLVSAHTDVGNGYDSYMDWFQTGSFGVAVGRHITRHLKVEADVSITGTGRRYVERYITVSGYPQPYPIGGEEETSFRSLSAAAVWQFFENEWIHPFVTAGVNANAERRGLRVWEQSVYRGDPRLPGSAVVVAPEHHEGPETSVRMQGLIGAGAKFYLSERAFVRADTRATFSGATQALSFRAGFGVDF